MIDSAGIKMSQGQTISCERIELVNFNMSKSHFHDFFEFYYLESGERYHMINDAIYTITAGQFVLFKPYDMHHSYGEKDIPFKRIVLYFRPSEIQSEQLKTALEHGDGVYSVQSTDRYAIHNLFNMLLQEENNSAPFKQECLHTLLNLLLITIERLALQPKKRLKQTLIGQVVDYIHKNYFNNITLEFLSTTFYISPYHLCREFKRCTNRTITQYINITRIMNAQRQIMETNKTFTQIARETGFSNLTHFNRVFKANAGMTPSKYKTDYKNRVAENEL